LPMEELMTIGFMFPATPVVNAISAVVAAQPGIVTYADLPPMTSIIKPKALKPSTFPLVEETPQSTPQQTSAGASSAIEGKWNVIV
jgi:hypothetical protein